MTDAIKKRIIKELKQHRSSRVRATWIRKKLKLTGHAVRNVRRVMNDAGYKLPKPVNRRVLDAHTKVQRVNWASTRLAHVKAYWGRRAFGDAHWWHIPRTAAELAANRGAPP